MPRGWKPRPTEKERLEEIGEETKKIIKTAMAAQGIEYDMDLAAMIGANRGTLYAKFKNATWTQKDLCKIIAALKIPASEAVKMLGVKL